MKKRLKTPGLVKAAQPRVVGLFGLFGADIKAAWIAVRWLEWNVWECVLIVPPPINTETSSDRMRRRSGHAVCGETLRSVADSSLFADQYIQPFHYLTQALCLFFLSPLFTDIIAEIFTKNPMQGVGV